MSSILENIKECLDDSNKYRERGDFYSEQKKYKQALEEYARSLERFEIYLRLTETTAGKTYYEGNIWPNVLFSMARIFMKIKTCYFEQEDYAKAAFFIKILKEIAKNLDGFKTSFNIEMLNSYETLIEGLKYSEALVSVKKDISDLKNQSNKVDDSDEIFKKICLELDRCCSYHICPLPARGIDKKAPYGSSSNSCFIATAAFSTSVHPDLDTFRSFRDEKLLTNLIGKQLVNLYYKIGPTIAQYVEKQPGIKTFLKQQLGHLAKWMRSRGVTSR